MVGDAEAKDYSYTGSYGAGDCFYRRDTGGAEVSMKVVMKMNIVVDETFSNIARYSNAADATASVSVKDG